MISHPAIKEAAGDAMFVARFRPEADMGIFETESQPIADALAALIDAGNLNGVKEVGKPAIANTISLNLNATIAKIAELTKPAEGEQPAKPPTLAQLAEAFETDDATLNASLADLVKATPEAAEALKAAGVEVKPEEATNGTNRRRGQRN